MKLTRTFFKVTRIFWVISRLVLGLIFVYCALFLMEDGDTADNITAALFALFGAILLWSFIAGLFLGGVSKWIRIFAGTVLILMGVIVIYATLSIFPIAEAALIAILPVWLLMAGIFEFVSISFRKNLAGLNELSKMPLNF